MQAALLSVFMKEANLRAQWNHT